MHVGGFSFVTAIGVLVSIFCSAFHSSSYAFRDRNVTARELPQFTSQLKIYCGVKVCPRSISSGLSQNADQRKRQEKEKLDFVNNQLGHSLQIPAEWMRIGPREKLETLRSFTAACTSGKRRATLLGVHRVSCGSEKKEIIADNNHPDLVNGSGSCESSCLSVAKAADISCGRPVMTVTGLATFAPMLSGMLKSPKGIRDACESQQKLAKVVTGLNGAFLTACGGSQFTCINACENGLKNSACARDHGAMQAALSRCEQYDRSVNQAMTQTLFSGVQLSAVLSCGSDSKAAAFSDFCSSNPGSQACKKVGQVDCSNAEQAKTPQCLCRDPATARSNPICRTRQPVNAKIGNFANAPNPAARGGDFLGASDLASLLGDSSFNGTPVVGLDSTVDATQTGKGGGGPSASGAPGGAAGGGSGHGKGPHDTDILRGVAKARGQAGSSTFSGYNREVSRRGNDGPVDLSQFLPGKPGIAREIAGMTVKPEDGITGPMGPSIWQKISRRYRKVRPFLKP